MTYIEQIQNLSDQELAVFLSHVMPVNYTTEVNNFDRICYALNTIEQKRKLNSQFGILSGDSRDLFEVLNQEPIEYKYEYIFEFFDEMPYGGWLLKITSEEQLQEYWDRKIKPMYAKARESRETADRDHTHDIYMDVSGLSCLIHNQGKYRYPDTIRNTREVMKIHKDTLTNFLKEHGRVYITRPGACCVKSDQEKPKLFVRKKTPDFPEYTGKDIRIKKFEGGTHYYAYVGEIQVHDEAITKWNTYDQAYEQALKFVKTV